MNKILISLAALLISLSAFVVSLLSVQVKDTDKAFGAFDAYVVRIASTTVTNFHQASGTRTATTTLLTIDRAFEAAKLALQIEVNATNTPGTIYILPETSQDTVVWFPLGSLHVATGASGAAVQSIEFGNGTSTQLTFSPVGQGTTTGQFIFDNPVNNLMRFRVWSTGTSSILLSAIKLLK